MPRRDRQPRQRATKRMKTDVDLVTQAVEARLPRDDDEAYYFALGILVRERGLSWDEAHQRARAVSRSFR
jgi:hypothetical protein